MTEIERADGERVSPYDIRGAVLAASLRYDDGATQVFSEDGGTVYTENGRPTYGQWYIDDDGRFCSFWPPSYRACYELSWVTENGVVKGLRFRDRKNGSTFVGQYQ